jgi:integrase
MLNDFKPAQKYLFADVVRLTDRMSENTVNFALKRMGYDGRLTGHALFATMSTALNEIGYPRVWVDAQLSHADPNRISEIYNYAQYVEQRRICSSRAGGGCEPTSDCAFAGSGGDGLAG